MSASLPGRSDRTRPSPVRLQSPQRGGSGKVRPASSLSRTYLQAGHAVADARRVPATWHAAYWSAYRDRARLRRQRDGLAWTLALLLGTRALPALWLVVALVALVLLSGGRP